MAPMNETKPPTVSSPAAAWREARKTISASPITAAIWEMGPARLAADFTFIW
jgi:hypothetical protein